MTRCIHCTRCIRFTAELAGVPELGATARGESMEVGTYVQKALSSELSGNLIDLCPVGALTAKPSRFTARPWELQAHEVIGPHDAMGTNLFAHVRNQRVMRVVPHDNEDVNETWISDRDRYSYRGLYSEERLQVPMVRDAQGNWLQTDWETALMRVVDRLKGVDGQDLGLLASANATVEELYLLRRLADELGCANIDHRLAQADFSDQDHCPRFPYLGLSIAEFEAADVALVVGSNLRKEIPLIHHRLRKAWLQGAKVATINPRDYEFRLDVVSSIIDRDLAAQLAGLALAASELANQPIPARLQAAVQGVETTQAHVRMAQMLKDGERSVLLLGQIAHDQPGFAAMRALAIHVAQVTGARLGYLPYGANAAGAWLAGAVPHRGLGGRALPRSGLNAQQMLSQSLRNYLLVNVEPELEAADPQAAMAALQGAEFVVSLTAYQSPALQDYADVMLPIGLFTETSGTYVNLEGRWQSFAGCSRPVGESRPVWKILRVLGNLLGFPGFEYVSSQDVLDEARAVIGEAVADNLASPGSELIERAPVPAWQRLGELPIYGADPLVRRADALQKTPDAQRARQVHLHPDDAQALGVSQATQITLTQNGQRCVLPLSLDPGLARGTVALAAGIAETAGLGARYGAIEIGAAEQGTR
jgi:NADH-quinone oxidoreductase subunit G